MALTPEDARTLLLARLDALHQENALAADSAAPVALEQDSVGRLSRMDALQVQAMALAGQRRRVAEKAQIEGALRRLDKGEYGYCLACGEEIAEARLRHNPTAFKCVECAD
jgi:DnaK suppressor protein